MTDPKQPAAVVWIERPDGRVLALTRGPDFADWHLPGGKWETQDGTGPHALHLAAVRELWEETGIRLGSAALHPVHDYVTRSGRPVRLFVADPPTWCPQHFPPGPAGQPAWVPRGMLTMPSCSFDHEARIVMAAVDRWRIQQIGGAA
jgi:8-oxo-dGTP pyrophosphatase MutT (NUDIX family)